jgi:hypothetical protein
MPEASRVVDEVQARRLELVPGHEAQGAGDRAWSESWTHEPRELRAEASLGLRALGALQAFRLTLELDALDLAPVAVVLLDRGGRICDA